jgi:DUF971 family protein
VKIYPTKLELDADGQLRIHWSDGQVRVYSAGQLRDGCPCATCREKRKKEAESPTQLRILTLEETVPLSIHSMKPVGNYAYSIAFSDGHDTGIYALELLRTLGHEPV